MPSQIVCDGYMIIVLINIVWCVRLTLAGVYSEHMYCINVFLRKGACFVRTVYYILCTIHFLLRDSSSCRVGYHSDRIWINLVLDSWTFAGLSQSINVVVGEIVTGIILFFHAEYKYDRRHEAKVIVAITGGLLGHTYNIFMW